MSLFASHTEPFTYATGSPALKELLEKYPYFSHAHFLLLKESNVSDADYSSIAAKTALHFANPFLLNSQLQPVQASFDHPFKATAPEPVADTVTKDEQPAENTQATETIIEPPVIIEETIGTNEASAETVEAENVPVAEAPVTKPAGESLLFEPLHTTDYFASQGIRLSETVQPTDKVGRQLKSFTEWLKTMKKVHPSGLEKKVADSPIDLAVQNMAEKSNIEEEIVTESMAEVYLQQGKLQKAREVYEKLSLLNPAKNAYFAAKLNEIQ
ncbi:MAG: hypothetical protein QM687_10655 [Ferruginibacter sp.]